MRFWNYTLILLASYVAVFEAWRVLPRPAIVASGVVVVMILLAMERHFARRGAFFNRWDRFIHASVILDILLEALLIPWHEGRGYYLCAAAFAVVIASYRRLVRRSDPGPAA